MATNSLCRKATRWQWSIPVRTENGGVKYASFIQHFLSLNGKQNNLIFPIIHNIQDVSHLERDSTSTATALFAPTYVNWRILKFKPVFACLTQYDPKFASLSKFNPESCVLFYSGFFHHFTGFWQFLFPFPSLAQQKRPFCPCPSLLLHHWHVCWRFKTVLNFTASVRVTWCLFH
jgi:hypothetical protein